MNNMKRYHGHTQYETHLYCLRLHNYTHIAGSVGPARYGVAASIHISLLPSLNLAARWFRSSWKKINKAKY
jgi:hypothetical protein